MSVTATQLLTNTLPRTHAEWDGGVLERLGHVEAAIASKNGRIDLGAQRNRIVDGGRNGH